MFPPKYTEFLSKNWLFGREFRLLQSGLFGREFGVLQSGCLGESLDFCKVVV